MPTTRRSGRVHRSLNIARSSVGNAFTAGWTPAELRVLADVPIVVARDFGVKRVVDLRDQARAPAPFAERHHVEEVERAFVDDVRARRLSREVHDFVEVLPIKEVPLAEPERIPNTAGRAKLVLRVFPPLGQFRHALEPVAPQGGDLLQRQVGVHEVAVVVFGARDKVKHGLVAAAVERGVLDALGDLTHLVPQVALGDELIELRAKHEARRHRVRVLFIAERVEVDLDLRDRRDDAQLELVGVGSDDDVTGFRDDELSQMLRIGLSVGVGGAQAARHRAVRRVVWPHPTIGHDQAALRLLLLLLGLKAAVPVERHAIGHHAPHERPVFLGDLTVFSERVEERHLLGLFPIRRTHDTDAFVVGRWIAQQSVVHGL